MKRIAEVMINNGADEKIIWACYDAMKEEKKEAASKAYLAKKAAKLANIVGNTFFTRLETRPIVEWTTKNLRAKKNITCETFGCESTAVRQVTVKYTDDTIERNICLKHYNCAHKLLTSMPAAVSNQCC